FDLTVTSGTAGTVALSVAGAPSGWKATLHGGGFVVSGISAAPGKPGTARLDVDIPADTTASTGTLTVAAKIGSQSASLAITVGVDAGVAGDITLTTSSPTLTGSSDSPFNFDLTLTNGSAQDQTVSATATGPQGWVIETKLSQANAASTVVKAGSSTTISVTATPPAGAPAGHTDLLVTATAGTKTITGPLGIDITGTYTMRMSPPGELLSAHGSAGSETRLALQIKNTGTAPLAGVTVTATPPTGWDVKYEPAGGKVDVPVGETPVTVTAIITPSADAVAGDYVVTFNAASAPDGTNAAAARSNADIRFTVETSPIWALVGLAVIALIIFALFYVFRTYGRR
ncbi:MAG: hypothetical protein H0V73_02135, partial [Chloroflexi bacterium]|nr:hypothetical protein [Chloroflexota bacterium]